MSQRIASDGWGKSTVSSLATSILTRSPGLAGYFVQNLWRLRQFDDTYHAQPKLSALLRELRADSETIFKDTYLLSVSDICCKWAANISVPICSFITVSCNASLRSSWSFYCV